MAVTLKRCVDAMSAAAGRPLTDDELIRVAERLQERVERLRRARGSASDDELLRQASQDLRAEALEEAALLRRSAMLQAAKYASLQGYVARFADPAEALRSLYAGTNTPGAPSRFSIDYRGKALADEWTGALISGLRQGAADDRLLTAFRRGSLDDLIAREMWAMPPGPVADGHAGVTGNADAAAIARIVHNTQEAARLRANRAGAWIGALPGYVVRQSHDALRLKRAGFDEWRRAIEPLLDETTFERAQARIDQLEAERADAKVSAELNGALARELPRQLTPFAKKLRELVETNRTAGDVETALSRLEDLLAPIGEAETARARAQRLADDRAETAIKRARRNEGKTGKRQRIDERQADALWRLADGIERMSEAADERALAKLTDRLLKDLGKAREQLDRSGDQAVRLGQYLSDLVDDINRTIDDRRRAEARLQAAELGLKDLEFRGRADDRAGFLQAVYNDIVSGRVLTPEANGNHVAGAGGSANVAMSMSRERVLQFRDADAWLQYHRSFGRPGNLASAAIDGLQRLGRHTALIETAGPNPVANLARLRRDLEQRWHGDTDAMIRLRSSGIDHLQQWITGEARGVENPTVATFGAVVRGFNAITKLGFMVLSSAADVVNLAAEAKFQGKGWLEGYRQGLEDLLEGRGSGDRRLISELAGAGLDGMTGAIGARFSAEDGMPGMMSWALRKMFALNLGSWWTDSHKIGATFMQMRGWALERGKAFADLDDEQRRLFGLYGIGDTHWDLLRASSLQEAKGRQYLVPAKMRQLPTDTVSSIVGRPLTDFEAIRILDDAGDRFSTLLADRADFAVPTPGGRELALMYGGHKPGSAWGEALRFFWQFKQFPVSVLTKPVSAIASNSESRIAAATALAPLFLQMTAMGYVAMSLKDVFKNKEPRPADKWETWIASAAQGGGLGLYGDFLFGEFNRFGRSWAESFMGPTLGGIVPDLAELNAKIIRGELKAAEAIRFGVNQIPFANLFYVKPVLDEILASEVYERLNPGYRQRAERDLQRNEGRGFLFHP